MSDLAMIAFILLFMLFFKDMSGKEELRKIRVELEKNEWKGGLTNGAETMPFLWES